MMKKDIAMKRTKQMNCDLKRDENFAQTSMKILRRRKRIRAVAVCLVAVGFGWLCFGVLRLFGGGAPAWVAPVLIGLVVVRFILRVLSALVSSLLLILLILALCDLL